MIFTLFVPGEVWTINKERKMHHHDRARMVEPLRQAAKLLTLNWRRGEGQGFKFDVPVEVCFVPHQRNRGVLADTANHLPACKAVLDGVADGGLIADDTPRWVLSQTFYPPIKTGTPGVLISVGAATDEG